MSERFVVTMGYGKCIEAVQRLDEALLRAVARQDHDEVEALQQDRAQWISLQLVTPRFVGEQTEVAGG